MSVDHPPAWRSRAAHAAQLYIRVFLAIAVVSMAIIVVVMNVQVIFRYALNSSLIWAEEICRYLLIVMTFLLIGVAYERGEMVRVHFFVDLLPRRIALLVAIPVQLAIIGFLCVVSYYGYRFATLNGSFSMPAIDFILSSVLGRPVSGAMSMYWIYLLIPVGCLLLGAHFVVALARTIRALFGSGEAD